MGGCSVGPLLCPSAQTPLTSPVHPQPQLSSKTHQNSPRRGLRYYFFRRTALSPNRQVTTHLHRERRRGLSNIRMPDAPVVEKRISRKPEPDHTQHKIAAQHPNGAKALPKKIR